MGVTSDQFAILLEEVRWLQEGQEDTALKLEKGVRPNLTFLNVTVMKINTASVKRSRTALAAPAAAWRERNKVVEMGALEKAKETLCQDVFSSGVWPLLSNLEDPELRRLAKALPATVLRCKADSTTKK